MSTDGGRQTEAHRAETAGADHGTRVPPAEVLGGPHLVLTDTGGDVSLVLAVGSQVAELLNDSLGLDELAALGTLVVGQRPLGLPLVDLGEPLLAVLHGLGGDVGHQGSDIGADITLDGLGSLDNLVDVLGHDLKLDNATTALSGGGLSAGCELGNVESDTVIETTTQGDDQISILDSHVGIGRTVHAEHVQRLLVELVKGTQTVESSGDRDGGLLSQFLEDLRTTLGVDDTVSGVDNGLLGNVEKLRNPLERCLKLKLHGLGDGSSRETGKRGVNGNSAAQNAGGDILGKVDEDRSGAARGGNLEGLVDSAGQFGDVLDHDVPLGARARDTDDIGLLEGITADGRGNDLASEDDEGNTVGQGILDGGDDIGCSGTGGNEDYTRLARGTSVTLGHVASTLLVSGKDEVEVF